MDVVSKGVFNLDGGSNNGNGGDGTSNSSESNKTVVGYDPVLSKKSKSKSSNVASGGSETLPNIGKEVAVSQSKQVPGLSRKDKAKQRAKERELARQMQRQRDLQKLRENEQHPVNSVAEYSPVDCTERIDSNVRGDTNNADEHQITDGNNHKSAQEISSASGTGKSKKARQKAKKKAEMAKQSLDEISVNASDIVGANPNAEKESAIDKQPTPPADKSNDVVVERVLAKPSRRKRARERDELAAKQASILEAAKPAANEFVASHVPAAEAMNLIAKLSSHSDVLMNMATLSEKLEKTLNDPKAVLDLDSELTNLAASPFGQFLLAQTGLNDMTSSSSDFNLSADTDLTPEGLTKAMLAIADTFLKSTELADVSSSSSSNNLANLVPSDFKFSFGKPVDVGSDFSSSLFSCPSEGNGTTSADRPDSKNEIPAARSNSSSKYINPFPMRHPNAPEIDDDSDYYEDACDHESNCKENVQYDSDECLNGDEDDEEYEDVYDDDYQPGLHLEDPNRAISFLNQGSTYISELLDSVRWMVTKGESLINCPTDVSPEVKELLITLEAENPSDPSKTPVPRRAPCQDLVDILEIEHEKCQKALKDADLELIRIIEINRKNAPELIEKLGLDPVVLEGICKIPMGVKYGLENVAATVKFS